LLPSSVGSHVRVSVILCGSPPQVWFLLPQVKNSIPWNVLSISTWNIIPLTLPLCEEVFGAV